MHIFRSRLRTFSEAPALFTMYKSEGPISKTSEPPDRRPGVAEITGGKGRRRPKKVSTCRDGDAGRNRFVLRASCVGPVTHVCPRLPNCSCRAQADLSRGPGRSTTLLRSTCARSRGNSGMRHSGPNRQPCSCHASRHPTGRHPSLTHLGWVPRACWTGAFGRRSSRWWSPRRTSRLRAPV